jgi:hypothetical protein
VNVTEAVFARAAARFAPPGERPTELGDPLTLAVSLDPGVADRPHLRIIAADVTDIEAGTCEALLVTTPPQVGKSTLAVEWTAFWWLILHPTARIIIASYGDDLAVKRGKNIRTLISRYGARYGLELEFGSRSMKDFSVVTGGGVRSVGIGSGLTGHGGDLLLIDDPHKDRQEADSRVTRDAIEEWYSSTADSRLSPGARVVMILTRWHDDDLAARLVTKEGNEADGGRWRVRHMPALATAADDPLGRQFGDPLPHPKIPTGDVAAAAAHWAAKRRTSTVRDWASIYQGDPQPVEGALVARELLASRRHLPPSTGVVRAAVAVDPSGGGRDMAGVVGGFLGEDQRAYVTADRSAVMSSEAWARAACRLAAELDADRVIVETNYGGDMAVLAVRTAWVALRGEDTVGLFDRLPPRVVSVRARKGKLLRAEPIAQQFVEDRARLGAYLPELEEEWCSWMPDSAESPGRLDASVYLLYDLLPVPGTGVVVGSPAGVDRRSVRGVGGAVIRRGGVGVARRFQ